MAIQHRRGVFNGFDPSRLVPGEWAVVLNGDPDARDGRSVYICFSAGTVKRMATIEDANDIFERVNGDLIDELSQQITDAVDAANNATSDANDAADKANSAAEQASSAAKSASDSASSATQAAQKAEEAASTLQDTLNDVTAATESANKAAGTANSSAAKADNATEAANDAADAANRAATDATKATETAKSAAGEAQQATEEASAATGEAQAAAEKASSAAQTASSSAQKADEATKAADEARGQAEAAATEATEAATKATESAGKADTAAGEANSAASTATQAATDANNAADKANQTADDILQQVADGEFDGATFTPSWLDDTSVLHWENDKGLENPPDKDLKGEMGQGLTIRGKYDSYDELVAAHPTGDLGDLYTVGTNLWVWDGTQWLDLGNIKGMDAEFGDITADIGTEVNNPSVQLDVSGTALRKDLAFHFDGLVGENGKDAEIFTLEVRENGDLYMYYDDAEDIPPFKLRENGDFYAEVDGGEVLYGNVKGTYWWVGTDVSRTDEGEVQVTTPVEGAREYDLYLNTDTGDIFRYESDTWVFVKTLEGGGGAATKPQLEVAVTIKSTPSDTLKYMDGEEVEFEIKVSNLSSLVTLYDVELTTALGTLQDAEGNKITQNELRPGASFTATSKRVITQADYGNQTMQEIATATNTLITAEGKSAYVPLPERDVNLTANKTITSVGTGDAGEYFTWDKVTYEIQVTNSGNIDLENITVAEALTGCEIVNGDGYTIETKQAKIAKLTPSQSVTVKAEYTVQESDVGKQGIVNTANVTAENPSVSKVATAVGFNVSSELRTLKVTTTITNEGTGTDNKFQVGDEIQATCTIKNESAKTYSGITVEVKAPEGATIEEGTGYSVATNKATIESMEQSNEVTVNLKYTVKEADLGKADLVFTVEVKAEEMTVPNSSDAANMEEIKRALSATVTVTNEGTGAESKFTTGDEVKFSIDITNTGNVTLSSITVTEQLSGATFEDGEGYTQEGATATITTLAPKAKATLTAKYTVTEEDIGNKSLTNSVKAQADITETTGTSAALSIEDEVQNVSITKTVNNEPSNGSSWGAGEDVGFDIVVTNIGNKTLTDIEVSEETADVTIETGTGYEISELKAKITSLAPKNDVTVKAKYTVKEEDSDKKDWKNQVRVVSGSVNVTGESEVVLFKPPFPDELEPLSWTEIQGASAAVAANPDQAQTLIGKEKTFEATGIGTFTAVCVDIAHFEKSDGSGKAGFVFQFKETVSTNYPMNGASTNTGGYPQTNMYKSSLPTTIFNALPTDLQSVICEVTIPYNIYNGSGQGDDKFTIDTTTAKLFLPSNREVWGITPLNGSGSNATNYYHTGEDGTQFAYWTEHPTIAEHIKYKTGSSTAANWWLRSCYPNTNAFVFVSTNGAVGNNSASGMSLTVAPCFCI